MAVTELGRSPLRAPIRVAVYTGIATVGVVAMDPQHTHIPLCPFHAITGWWCPLCGGLRAVNAAARGHLGAALHDNVLLMAGLPILVWIFVDWTLRRRDGRAARSWPRWATVALVVLGVVFTVVRNLPALDALRPT
jgi:Protein of unknown function (DUF2752)